MHNFLCKSAAEILSLWPSEARTVVLKLRWKKVCNETFDDILKWNKQADCKKNNRNLDHRND